MNKKVIFVDIDGTIIARRRGLIEPTEKTVYAFKELKKNHYVFLCSGRTRDTFPLSVAKLEMSGFVGSNGQYVEVEGKPIYYKTFDKDLVKRMIEYIKENNGAAMIIKGPKAYSIIYDKETYKELTDRFFEDTRFSEDEKDYEASLILPVFKDVGHEEKLNEHFKGEIDVRPHTSKKSFDIGILGESKGKSVTKVLEYLGINKDDAYCFGDELNDMEMMKAVTHSVCMGSGNPKVKEMAESVCEDVNEDGFYHELVRKGLIKPLE